MMAAHAASAAEALVGGPLDFPLEALRASVPASLRARAAEAAAAGRCVLRSKRHCLVFFSPQAQFIGL